MKAYLTTDKKKASHKSLGEGVIRGIMGRRERNFMDIRRSGRW